MESENGICTLTRLAAPLTIGFVAQAVNELVDRGLLGNFSQEALSAVLPAGLLAGVFTGFLAAAIGYSGTIVAQRLGTDDRMGAKRALFHGLVLAALAIPVLILGWPLGEVLLSVVGHPPSLRHCEGTYLRFALAAGALTTFGAVLGGFFTAQKRTRIVCLASVTGCFANVVIDILAVPATGIVGAGLGLVGAGLVTNACLVGMLCLRPWIGAPKATDRTKIRLARSEALLILRHGLPFGLSSIVGAGSYALFTLTFARLGSDALAAGNAVLACHAIVFFVLCAIEQAVQALVGRAYGRGDLLSARQTIRSALVLALACVLMFYAVTLPFARTIAGLFCGAAASERFADIFSTLLALMVVRDVLEGIQRAYTGALCAVGNTPAVLRTHALVSLGIWVPLFLFTVSRGSIVLTWLSMTVDLALQATILHLAWRRSALAELSRGKCSRPRP